jgi:hypothetical protein
LINYGIFRRGFTVTANQLTGSFGTATRRMAECRASTELGSDSITFMLVIIAQNSDLLPQLTSNTSFPYQGQKLELQCSVETDQTFTIDFTWEYPLSAQVWTASNTLFLGKFYFRTVSRNQSR